MPDFLAGAVIPARATPSPRIEISGNRLTWGGQTLRLRGVAMGDPVYIRAGRSLADYATIAADWSANCVRISVHPGHWRYDPAQMAALLDADVQAARSHGLFVIIDWHAIGFPGLYQPVPPPQWGLPADAYLSSIADAASLLARHGRRPMARTPPSCSNSGTSLSAMTGTGFPTAPIGRCSSPPGNI